MTTYTLTTPDGLQFTGKTANAVVRQMRAMRWGLPLVKRDYKREVLERVAQQSGVSFGPTPNYLSSLALLEFIHRTGVARLFVAPTRRS